MKPIAEGQLFGPLASLFGPEHNKCIIHLINKTNFDRKSSKFPPGKSLIACVCTLNVGNGVGVSIRGLFNAGSLPFLTNDPESRTSSLLV